MKKVLFVIHTLSNGGAERSLVNLLNELPADGYSVDVLLFKRKGMFLNQLPEHVHVLETPEAVRKLYAPMKQSGSCLPIKLMGTLSGRLHEKQRLNQRAYRWKHFYSRVIPKLDKQYDVAVAYISGEILFYVDEKVNANKKYVWIHNDYRTAGHPKKYEQEYLRRMDGIVSISERCVAILREEFPEFKDKLHCIENITSGAVVRKRAEEFVPTEYAECENNILSVGRLMKQKGFDMAIRAAAILKKSGVRFHWHVVGDGELKDELEALIRSEDVSDCFSLIGPRENPYPYMRNCTLFAQTSLYEGKSVVIDEAKIVGAPIVVTNYPTVRDQVANEMEAKIVEMSPEGIAEGIRTLLEQPEKRRAMREYLLAHDYGNQDEVQKYIQLFEG